MSKKGVGYALSREKRNLDKVVASSLLPLYWATGLAVKKLLPPGVSPLFEQERVGQNREAIVIHKYRTKCPETKEVLGVWAHMLRKGPDELAQMPDVLAGIMSVCGWRPLVRSKSGCSQGDTSFEEFYDHLPPSLQKRHDAIVLPTPPGILSTYGIEDHFLQRVAGPDKFEKRAENNIQDVLDCSRRNYFKLMNRFIRLSVLSTCGVEMPIALMPISSEVVIPLPRQETGLPESMLESHSLKAEKNGLQ